MQNFSAKRKLSEILDEIGQDDDAIAKCETNRIEHHHKVYSCPSTAFSPLNPSVPSAAIRWPILSLTLAARTWPPQERGRTV